MNPTSVRGHTTDVLFASFTSSAVILHKFVASAKVYLFQETEPASLRAWSAFKINIWLPEPGPDWQNLYHPYLHRHLLAVGFRPNAFRTPDGDPSSLHIINMQMKGKIFVKMLLFYTALYSFYLGIQTSVYALNPHLHQWWKMRTEKNLLQRPALPVAAVILAFVLRNVWTTDLEDDLHLRYYSA